MEIFGINGYEEKYLLIEYQHTYDKVANLEKLSFGFINAVIAIITITVAIASADIPLLTMNILLIAFPLLINIICILAIHYIIRCFRLGGYLRYLEEKANQYSRFPVARWESNEAEKEHKNYVLLVLFSLVYILIIILPIATMVYYKNSLWWWVITVPILVCEVTVIVRMLLQVPNAHKKVYLKYKLRNDEKAIIKDGFETDISLTE